MKLTKKRQQILNLVQSSDTPINAKFLKSKVDFDLSTVYRALEFLEKNNYIFSFDFENEKYYFKEENANFFICVKEFLKLIYFDVKKWCCWIVAQIMVIY